MNDRYAVSGESPCPKQGQSKHYMIKCLTRKCNDCGTKVNDSLLPDTAESGRSQVQWFKWVSEAYVRKVGNVEKKGSQKVLQQVNDTVEDLVKELLEELKQYALHLFNAKWQYEQFLLVSENPPKDWVIMCMDFAENFTCAFQDEIESAHWNHAQVTLHPIICYYCCPKCEKVCTSLWCLLVMISNTTATLFIIL